MAVDVTNSSDDNLVNQNDFDNTKPAENDPIESAPMRHNFQALTRANDLRVYATDPPSDEILIAPGIYTIDDETVFRFSGEDQGWKPGSDWNAPDVSTGDARIDLLGFNEASAGPVIEEGTAAADPTPPDIPTNMAASAFIYIDSQENPQSIDVGDIYDARYMVSAPRVNDSNVVTP